jgi:hypothetical protein
MSKNNMITINIETCEKGWKHRSDRRHVEVLTQPHVNRWWWCTACVVNDRLRGCADKVQDGIKFKGCASHRML